MRLPYDCNVPNPFYQSILVVVVKTVLLSIDAQQKLGIHKCNAASNNFLLIRGS